MVTMIYDGSWPGLVTAVFEVFEYKFDSVHIVKDTMCSQSSLFTSKHQVVTNTAKSDRVEAGIVKKMGKVAWHELYLAFLSELDGVENLILRLVQYYTGASQKVSSNYGHEDVLRLKQINKSISRERHRFKAFVRFRQLQDGLFFAKIEPDFNILPLIIKHFKDRYADQPWLIYDIKRDYGVLYNLSEVLEVYCDQLPSDQQEGLLLGEEECLYGDLWKRYFNSTNIKERKNTKLHLQHVPKRYWKYLNEKW